MSCGCERIDDFRQWDEKGRYQTWAEWLSGLRGGWQKPFGKTTRYTWRACGRIHEMVNPNPDSGARVILEPLPDWSGLIMVDSRNVPNNAVLLDPCGEVLRGLRVPWEMVSKDEPEECYFVRVARDGTGWNEATGEEGRFGLEARLCWSPWVYGDFYFELDWHRGEFLWRSPLR